MGKSQGSGKRATAKGVGNRKYVSGGTTIRNPRPQAPRGNKGAKR